MNAALFRHIKVSREHYVPERRRYRSLLPTYSQE